MSAARRARVEGADLAPVAGPRPLTTCLFDLDGTLIDSIDLILASYTHTLVTHRGQAPAHEVWLEGLGIPLKQQFALFSADPVEIEAVIATYRAHNLAHHDALVRNYPGALAAVQALHARGLQLGIVTSKRSDAARRGLALCGFEGLFETLVGVDDVRRHKPDPEPVLRALEQLGADPLTTVFVGDSPHDLAAGRAAGVRTAAARWGPFPRERLEREAPDWWLESPPEITRLLDVRVPGSAPA